MCCSDTHSRVSDLAGVCLDAPPELGSALELPDSKDTDEDAPMDMAVDEPDEEIVVGMEFDEKLNILEGNAGMF